jgi:hypothetical protein
MTGRARMGACQPRNGGKPRHCCIVKGGKGVKGSAMRVRAHTCTQGCAYMRCRFVHIRSAPLHTLPTLHNKEKSEGKEGKGFVMGCGKPFTNNLGPLVHTMAAQIHKVLPSPARCGYAKALFFPRDTGPWITSHGSPVNGLTSGLRL